VPTALRSLARSLSVTGRIFPRRLSPYGSGSTRTPVARHTTHQKRHRLPKTEMHAVRQRTTKLRLMQVAEMARVKIFSKRSGGSLVSR
jgi:hypothetical protein